MSSEIIDSQFLKIFFRFVKYKPNQAGEQQYYNPETFDGITKTITLNAINDGTNVSSCFYDNSQESTSSANPVTDACQGSAVIATPTQCKFSSLELENCPQGFGIEGTTFNGTNSMFESTCSNALEFPPCPHGRIKSISPSGVVTCLDTATLASNETTTFSAGDNCRVMQDNSGKLKVDCAAGACMPACPPANTICLNTTYTGADGCGGNCNVIGTMACPVHGECGPAHNTPTPLVAADRCQVGTAANQAPSGAEFTWNCLGTNGGNDASCFTNTPPSYVWVNTNSSCMPYPGPSEEYFNYPIPDPEGTSCTLPGNINYWQTNATCWNKMTCNGTAPINCYIDGDGDEFGAGAVSSTTTTTCPVGEVSNNTDCCDSDANAYPGQSSWFTTPRNVCGGFDYDCNSNESRFFQFGFAIRTGVRTNGCYESGNMSAFEISYGTAVSSSTFNCGATVYMCEFVPNVPVRIGADTCATPGPPENGGVGGIFIGISQCWGPQPSRVLRCK